MIESLGNRESERDVTGRSGGTTMRISHEDGEPGERFQNMIRRPESISLKDRITSLMRVENSRSMDPETGIPEVKLS